MGFYKNTNSGSHSVKKYLIREYVYKIINNIALNRMACGVDIDVSVDDNFVVTVSNKNIYSHSLETLMIMVNRSKVRVDVGNDMVAGVYFMQNGYNTIVDPPNPAKYIFRLNSSVIDEILK